MNKIFQVFLVVLLIGGSATFASANLIQNSSFELNNAWASPADFDNWKEYGNFGVTSYARTGSYAARISDGGIGGSTTSSLVSDKFNITELGTYEFGAWFALKSSANPTTVYNNDRVGLTANIYWDGGGAIYPNQIFDISGAPVSSWTYDASQFGWVSNWIFIGSTFEVTAAVLNGELNIYLQNYNNALGSSVYVDDAFLQKMPSVPEPATILLLGFGLVGLAGFGRKKFKN